MRNTSGVAARISKDIAFPLLLLLLILSATLLSEELATTVKSGLRLAVGSIIPALFPFMILADVIVAASADGSRLLTRPIERLFGISPSSARAFIVGSVAGAPIGAAMLSHALNDGTVSRDEADRTLAISSSPSLAFAVSGVGAAMWGDALIGALLYLSVIIGSIIYGTFTRRSGEICDEACAGGYCFDLMASIERATLTSLRVVGVVTAFSIISGLVVRFSTVAPFIIPLFEVGNAASYLSECALPRPLALAFTAFGLGFSGISIHLQVMGAVGGEIRYSRFLFSKILIGLGAAAIFSIAWLLIK